MRIQLTLYGELKRYVASGLKQIDVADGTTVAQLLAGLGIDAAHPRIAAVNEETVDEDTVLVDGDDVEVFHAVAGG